MHPKGLYCYSTNNKYLGKKAKIAAKKLDDTECLYEATAVLAAIQGLISCSILMASNQVTVKISEPHVKDVQIAKEATIELKFKPIRELDITKLNDGGEFHTIAEKVAHQAFSKLEDKLYGEVLKFTTHIYCQDNTNYKELSSLLSNILVERIINKGIPNQFDIKLPVGNQVFEINFKATIIK